MKKLLGISYFSYICLFWVRDPNLLTESAGTVLPVSLSSVSSFSWLLKICLSHWNLSRHFSHIRGVLASENTERFPNSWVTLRHFFSKNKQKKVISMAVRIPSQKLRAQEREKFQILNESAVLWSSWHHSHSACSKSETQRAPCSLIVTSTLPHKSAVPSDLAATKALAEIIHTNLKTRTVSEILLTQEPWGKIQTAAAGSGGLDESLLQIPNW